MIRQYTNKLLDFMEEGVIDPDRLVHQLLCFMSERDVKQFYESHYEEELEPKPDESYEDDFGNSDIDVY